MYGSQTMNDIGTGVLAVTMLMVLIIMVITFFGVFVQNYYKGYAKFAIILTMLFLPFTFILYWIFARPVTWLPDNEEEIIHDW